MLQSVSERKKIKTGNSRGEMIIKDEFNEEGYFLAMFDPFSP
jgi:hypothetical protein